MTRLAILPPWTRETITLLGTMPDPTLAAQVGISAYAVKAERKRRGIAPCGGGRRPRGGERAGVIRTIKLTPDEATRHDAARGEQPWPDFARESIEQRITRGQM